MEQLRYTLAEIITEIINRYIEDILPSKKPGSARAQTYQLEWWKEQLGPPYTLDRITPALISEYRDKLLRNKDPIGKKRSPSTVARFMSALSHVFTIAVKEWQLVDDNPFRRVTKPKEPRGVVRFLIDDKRRSVPLAGHALELMKERSKVRNIDSDYVFPGHKPKKPKTPIKPIDLTRPWKNALDRAKIKNFRWHDLRHSAASYLAMNGATLAEIKES